MALPDTTHPVLALWMFLGAALYTSAGHGGAPAYIALMALFGLPAATMRPAALVGSTLGIGSLSPTALLKALGCVLIIAAAKLFGVY